MRILSTVIALWMAASAAAAAPPAPGPLADEQKLPAADGRDAYEPAAAFGGDVFLVAFKSGHLGPGDLRKGFDYVADIAACRLDRNGKLLDAVPLAVSRAADLQERPRIAFGPSTGSGQAGVFLVVWQDIRNGRDWDVYAARVTPAGKVLDEGGLAVAAAPHNQALPDVAWDGKSFQVVWQDFRCGDRYEIYGARVSADGKVLDPEGRLLASEKAPVSRYGPVIAAAAGGGKSLLFWRGSQSRKAMAGCQWLVGGGPDGAPPYLADPSQRAAPGGADQANFPMCLSAGPDAFLGTWTTRVPLGRGNAANNAHAALFTAEGKCDRTFLLTGEGGVSGARIRNPAAAWDGTRFIVAWDQYDGKAAKAARTGWPVEAVRAAAVGPDGSVSDSVPVIGTAAEPAIKPAVASDAAGTTLIACEHHPAKGDTPIAIGVRMIRSE